MLIGELRVPCLIYGWVVLFEQKINWMIFQTQQLLTAKKKKREKHNQDNIFIQEASLLKVQEYIHTDRHTYRQTDRQTDR